MSRSIKEIYNAIVNEKQTFSELNSLLPDYPSDTAFGSLLADLSSNSKVAIWRLWVFITAVAIYYHERIFDKHKEEVQDIANSMQVGKLEWYASESRKFQLGFPLAFNNTTFRYYYLDSTSEDAVNARIINRVSAREVFSTNFTGIRIKVAKSIGVDLNAISEDELEAFKFYIQRIAFAGIPVDVWSKEADKLKYNIRIWFDGVLPENDILTAIQQAINSYLIAIPFDGMLYRNKLIDTLQELTPVRDVEIVSLQSQRANSVLWIDAGRFIEPESGYFKTDPTSIIQLIAE
ncbi:MAG: hypothetical protein M9958_00525 [Chitinophagales bacterium]|nr:hypothetical protein [Chitinophagales bacterium]